jgi:nucleoid-associated protein YgaU
VKNRRHLGFSLVCTALALALVPLAAFAQSEDGMTYEEYEMQLAGVQQNVQEIKQKVQECKDAGDMVAQQITGLEEQIAGTMQDLLDLVGCTDQACIDAYMAALDRIEGQLRALMNLPDADLFDQRDHFDSISEEVEGLKQNNIRHLPKAKMKLKTIVQLIERIAARMPAKKIKDYTVLRNDNLWKIARSEEIYDNAYLWPRIYLENRDKIKHPDLIYPNWVLQIPFGVDRGRHLVLQGHTLTSIAGMMYNDPSKWHRIYRANKSQIRDPNLIFPAQVIDVPEN